MRKAEFVAWVSLPERALHATKQHLGAAGQIWPRVVFVRAANGDYLLDPKKALRINERADSGRIRPKSFAWPAQN